MTSTFNGPVAAVSSLTSPAPQDPAVSQKPKIFLADDHFLITETLSVLLAPEFDVVGSATSSDTLVDEVVRLQPDVVVLDITMPGLSGLDAARAILERVPASKIVFLTMHKSRVLLREAFRAGAVAYVVKDCGSSALVAALKAALAGERYLSPDLEAVMAQPDHDDLSERQVSVLRLIAQGCSAKQIAFSLNISSRTAEFHKNSIMDKLKLRTTAQLTRYAIEHGLTT
jgi:DNA-binding NarL/FixJ family response regulator